MTNFVTLLFEKICRNPKAVTDCITKARSVGVPKKDGVSIRPICITSVLRRIWGKIILRTHSEQYAKLLSERNTQRTQLVVGIKGKNAFNCVDRTRMIDAFTGMAAESKQAKEAKLAILSFVNAVYAGKAKVDVLHGGRTA